MQGRSVTESLRLVVCAALLAASTAAAGGPIDEVGTGESRPARPSGCSPVSGGTDSFPSTIKLVVDDQGFGEPFVVRLSSVDQPDGMLQRDPQVGDVIATELIQLELTGFHPRLGSVTLRESTSRPSDGEIVDVVQDGGCQFAGGNASVDLFVELELPGLTETWFNPDPVRLEAPLAFLPADNVSVGHNRRPA